jgi:hypothetical protein
MQLSKKITAGVVAVLAVFAGSAAFAQIPDATGTVHACYNTKSGALRVTDAPQPKACSTKEAPLDLNQKGPAGPPGPKGDPGTMADEVIIHQDSWNTITPLNGLKVVSAYGGGVGFNYYLVTAKIVVGSTENGTHIQCNLVQFPSQKIVDSSWATITTGMYGEGLETITLTSAIGIGIVQVQCNPTNASFYSNVQMTLLPVKSVDSN